MIEPNLTILCYRHGGTHLIKPFVRALTDLPIVDVFKQIGIDHKPNGPVVVALRDPRNVFVSQMRWKAKRHERAIPDPGTPEADAAIARFIIDGKRPDDPWSPINTFIWVFRRWGSWPGSLRVDFEDLTGDGRGYHAQRLADHLGKPGIDAAALLASKMNRGQTYTGQHSDFRKWFGPKSWAAWENGGGPTLARLTGYSDGRE